jgi:hypothetical protein
MLTINIPEGVYSAIKADAEKNKQSIKDYILSAIKYRKQAEEQRLREKYSKTAKEYSDILKKLKDL